MGSKKAPKKPPSKKAAPEATATRPTPPGAQLVESLPRGKSARRPKPTGRPKEMLRHISFALAIDGDVIAEGGSDVDNRVLADAKLVRVFLNKLAGPALEEAIVQAATAPKS